MANPNVIAVTPQPSATDVILGSNIVVTFDSLIDPSTITTSTFCLMGPAQTQILTPTQLISSDPNFINGNNYIKGSFSTTINSSNQTVLTFTPKVPLQPNLTYTVLLVGLGALLVSNSIRDLNGNPLSSNYQWSFSTGELNTKIPPLQAPLPYQYPSIDPAKIRVLVNGHNPGDFLKQDIGTSYQIQLIFPASLDTTSFEPTDILLSLEQFLGDPTIPFPCDLTPNIVISGNTITITISEVTSN